MVDAFVVPTDTPEAQELLQSFQTMAPLMRTLRPPMDESGAKRHRGTGDGNTNQVQHWLTMVKTVNQSTKLCLQLDSDMQALKGQDSFVIYMATNAEALLPAMTQKAAQWKQEREQRTTQMSLRQAMSQFMFQELLNRAQQLAQAKASDANYKMAVERQILDSNGCWLYHRWDQTSQRLVADNKTPAKTQTMMGWLQELVEASTDSK